MAIVTMPPTPTKPSSIISPPVQQVLLASSSWTSPALTTVMAITLVAQNLSKPLYATTSVEMSWLTKYNYTKMGEKRGGNWVKSWVPSFFYIKYV